MSAIYDKTVRPEFDPPSGTYRVDHDPDCPCTASTTVVLALASLTEADPLDMLPLHRAVDPDALEHHVCGRGRDARLSFEFHGHHVTVRSDGHIKFAPLDDRGE